MSDNLYAGASIQVYPSGDATLSTPHSDVQAFLDYVGQFNSINFHAMDDDVREWRYNHEFDNWQDRLGMDSVKVFYHYGHCGMLPNGMFGALMGRTWDNTLQADTTRMSFGDQRLRYLFWHGCDSLQMHFGQNPFRTWATANKGTRMIFGFDSLTYDVDGLGAGFFREWNTGKSFSQAWQDAAFGIWGDHRPASTACGATAQEAQDRLWNERLFEGAAVSDNWYWWRWAGPAPLEVDTNVHVPSTPGLNFQVERQTGDEQTAARIADRFGVRPMVAAVVSPEPRQYAHAADAFAGPRLVLMRDGSYQAFLAEPTHSATPVSAESAKARADRAVRELGLEVELSFDRMTATHHAGASRAGDAAKTMIRDYTAHYRQRHEGIPMARGADGQVRVTIDSGGTLCAIADSTVAVVGAAEARPPYRGDEAGVDRALEQAAESLRKRLQCDGARDVKVTAVPGTREVCYRVDRDSAVTVARESVEVRTGNYAVGKILEVTV
jgi:Family of unknown function (DUF6345)